MNQSFRSFRFAAVAAALLIMAAAAPVLADDSAAPVGEPVLERPTLRSLGTYWIVRGDANKNAVVRVDYRKAGGGDWRQGPPLFRVEKGAHKTKEHGSLLKVPDDAWLFAGSVVMLEPKTKYEIKLTLSDPDGATVSKTLSSATVGEPIAPAGPMLHVVPGDGGGSGKANDPYKGLAAAEKNAKAGDTFLLHVGMYNGAIALRKNGSAGKPIIWRGAGDGEAIIDGQGAAKAIEAVGLSDRWFEGLTIRNATYGIVAHESARLVLRRCHIEAVDFGIAATKNEKDNVNDYFITDNRFDGPSTWPRSKGIEDVRAIQVSGAGHVIAYNRIRAFGDAIDTMPSPRCESIDIHNNDCDVLTDDGIETDYSQRNVRVFENRITNAFQGISTQPVYGGPVYIFRNVLFNIGMEPFKMHNGPSGALFYHNTIVKNGIPSLVYTPKPIHNLVSRNNLYVGTAGGRAAIDFTAPAEDCDFDYDGFAGGPFENWLRWNDKKYKTFADMTGKAPVYKNAVELDASTLFASGLRAPETEKTALDPKDADVQLAPSSKAIEAGQKLPGFNDDHAGAAPDLGAYELGATLPHYGPREK
ncbi:MAG: hypothetical protein QOF78_2311 [Phycisphaerales bacterium]|nr:hypothetical protein [Phycisphaerales bacterium]